jgi:UDP-2,4-diacetamido-2,4,6-trideoxy-beta-L-altropyranose hydrolase
MLNTTIVFRTDVSPQIGSGHVMRCLALADELRQQGAEVLFIIRQHPSNLIGLVENKGFAVARLPLAEFNYVASPEDALHAEWLSVSWLQDATDTVAALGEKRPDWLIVDHYAIDRRWEEKLRPAVGKIMVIDDLENRQHDCDLLLDQNLHDNMGNKYEGLVPAACEKLLGPRYALLRQEFRKARQTLAKRSGIVRRILIFFGGSDPTNETAKALEAFCMLNRPDIFADVVVGKANPRRHELKLLCDKLTRVAYHCQVDNMADLMVSADLALGAGGTATWERCALGLPTVVISVSDNQLDLASTAARQGIVLFLGTSSNVSSDLIKSALNVFVNSPESLSAFSANSLATVDAKGCQRVGAFLCPPRIVIRRAVDEDCDSVYEWRNSEETRRHIFDTAPIPLETHRRWFCDTLVNPNRVLLIGEIDKRPVGVIRYDMSGEEALVSIYLVPGIQGHGVGTQLIREGSRWLRQFCTQIQVINADICRENVASLRAFEQAGFKEHHISYKEVV